MIETILAVAGWGIGLFLAFALLLHAVMFVFTKTGFWIFVVGFTLYLSRYHL